MKKDKGSKERRNLIIILISVIIVIVIMLISSGTIKLPIGGSRRPKINFHLEPSKKIDYKSMGKPDITKDDRDLDRKFANKEQMILDEYNKLKAYLMEEGMELDISLDSYVLEYENTKLSDKDFFDSYYEMFKKDKYSIAKDRVDIDTDTGSSSDSYTGQGETDHQVQDIEKEVDLERTELRFKYGLSEEELDILMEGHERLENEAGNGKISFNKSLEEYLEDFRKASKSLIGLDKAGQFNQNTLKSFGLE